MGTPSSSFLTSTHLSEHSSPIALWGYYLTPIKLPPLAPNNTRTFFFFAILGLYPWHMEVPRLGVESELQLPAYTTATAAQDLSCICNLHRSSRQLGILDPLSEARDRTRVLMDPHWVHYHGAMTGTPECGYHLISGSLNNHTVSYWEKIV